MIVCPIDGTPLSDGQRQCSACGEDLSLLVDIRGLPQRLYREAVQLARSGEYSAAAGALTAATRLAPDLVDPWIVLGKVYARQGHYHEAIAVWHQALTIDPTNRRASQGIQAAEAQRHADERRTRQNKILKQALMAAGLVVALLVGGGFVQWWQAIRRRV